MVAAMNTHLCIRAGDTAGGGAAVAQGAHLCDLTRYLRPSSPRPTELTSTGTLTHSFYPVTLPTLNTARLLHFCQLDRSNMEFHLITTVVPYPCPTMFFILLWAALSFFSAHWSTGLFIYSSCFLYILEANPFFVCCSCMLLCTQLPSTKLCLCYTSVFYKSNTGYSDVKQTRETVLLTSSENRSRERWTETGPG